MPFASEQPLPKPPPWIGAHGCVDGIMLQALTEPHVLHEPPPWQQQQQPAMLPQPALAPQSWVVKISHWKGVGVAAATAVGAVIERIRGAATIAPPTCAERLVSSRRVIP